MLSKAAKIGEFFYSAIKEATDGGYMADPDENGYTREIARLSALGGQYESEFMTFSFSVPKSPLVLSVQREMVNRGLHQKPQ